MSDMKQLLESVTKFAGEPKQKTGDQVRGTEKAKTRKDGKHPFAGRLVGGSANESIELEESLMQEYKYFVGEQTPTAANTTPTSSPVANINPAGTGTTATQPAAGTTPAPAGAPATNTATTAKPPVTGQAPAPAPGQPPKPGQPAPAAAPAGQAPATPGQPAKPATGAPGAGTATPPNPQQVKSATDTVTKIMNNPADPFNAQLQALLKKAGMVPR